jgi:hypothetical protein
LPPNPPPAGTPISIERPPTPPKGRWPPGVRLAIALVVVASIGWALWKQWASYRDRDASVDLDVHWGPLLASGLIVFAAYGVLIQTWRLMLGSWAGDNRLSFLAAARIWFVSNLGRYVPGKLWQIAAMGLMAEKAGVSPIAAAGSAILNTIVNIGCGIAISIVLGWSELETLSEGHGTVGIVLLMGTVAVIVALPWLIPRAISVAERISRRRFASTSFPRSAIAYAVVGNLIAWALYGLAFRAFVVGLLGSAPGGLGAYIAVWATSYVVGYLVLFAPAGIGAREGTLAVALHAFKLANPGEALVITVMSRVWITLLEIFPGVAFYAVRSRPGSNESRNSPT